MKKVVFAVVVDEREGKRQKRKAELN